VAPATTLLVPAQALVVVPPQAVVLAPTSVLATPLVVSDVGRMIMRLTGCC
jgi:hypothetical protein